MFDWLASWFGSWVPLIGQQGVNLVHWALRAVAGWAGNIFKAVGGAWSDFYQSHLDFLSGLDHFAWRVWRHFEAIVKHDLPWLWRFATFIKHWASAIFIRIWHTIVTSVHELIHLIERVRNDIVSWVRRDIYCPLKAYADHIWHDLIQWGYTAWYYITHPDKLAAWLFWHIVGLIETNAWDVAGKLGGFLTALFLHNIRRTALLIEEILHAVL